MAAYPKTCVIGAGSSGMVTLKKLRDAGIPTDCFEKSDRIGGNWVIRNKNGLSAAYTSLHIDSSVRRTQFAGYPMPDDYPDFPHHSLMARYFEDYARHFGLHQHITFDTGVEKAVRGGDGLWEVTLDTGETRRYDALVVANGHHWNPRWPEPGFPGEFHGRQMHSHEYLDPEGFKGQRVVVVGMGNSAMDIAVDLSRIGSATYLAARRGAYVIPKYLFGKPLDRLSNSPHMPYPIQRLLFALVLRLHVGKMENYGLPKPDHRLGEAHPTVSSEVLSRIGHGDIQPKPNIEALEGDAVRFTDGSVEKADTIIYATGYKVTFPFFDEDFISAPDNDLPLFRRVFKPDVNNVFFIGLCQPLGAIMPIAEAQGEWIAEYLTGRYALPSEAALAADMERERQTMFKRFVASKRHTMQVDFDHYMHQLGKERKRGIRRAAKQGGGLPVAPRAGE